MAFKVFTNKGELMLNTIGGGGGSGTVTDFSSGDLSPLFITSVATSTTTPALSFTLSTQAANLVFAGPSSGPDDLPTFRAFVSDDLPAVITDNSSINGLVITANTATITTGTWNGTRVSEAYGGTNQSTYVAGDVLYASAANTLSKLGIGSAGQVLTVAGGIISWATPTTGTVTSVSGTANRITSTGGVTPVIDISASYVGQTSITALGTITTGVWSATAISETKGGTNQTSYITGDILYASALNTLSKLNAGASAGLFLRNGGASAAPEWSAVQLLNAGTAHYIPYWSGTNTQGESANLQFDGNNLGIGMVPVNSLDITKNTNGAANISLFNNSSGTSAQMRMLFNNNTNSCNMGFTGENNTIGSYVQASCMYFSSGGTNGINFVAASSNANAQIKFWTNTTQRVTIAETGGMFVGGSTAATALLHIAAGAEGASLAPIKLTTGTLQTTAEAGALEYTTPTLYFTNGGAQRQEIILSQQTRVSTQFDKTNDAALAAITGLTATLVAGKIYRFEAELHVTADVVGGSQYSIDGTATATAIIYEIIMVDNTSNLNTITARKTALAGASGQAGTTSGYVRLVGLITVNAAGTLTPKFAQNAATAATTSSVLVGSTFIVEQIA